MIRAAIVGGTGRMGQAILRAAGMRPDVRISAAIAPATSADLGADAGTLAGAAPLGVAVTSDLQAALAGCDVVMDFSRASATAAHLAACRTAKKPLVLGTTGHGADLEGAFAAAAAEIPLLIAPNTSLAVAVLMDLAASAAHALGPEFDVEILECHHRTKADAPSGTALALGAAVATARGQKLSAVGVMNRNGGAARKPAEIGFASVRGGDAIGTHTVAFLGPGEELTLTHRATDRAVFARGALLAAVWLAGRPPGRYSMRDIFNFKTVA
jgi:4-hydroxy-tetrahydrodipicolinate reductase